MAKAQGSIIRYNSTANQTKPNILSGSYRLTKTGTNTLTLSNTYTATGIINVKQGTLSLTGASIRISSGGAGVATNLINVDAGANLTIGYTGGLIQNYNGIISGTGTINLNGARDDRINSAGNTFTGIYNIANGNQARFVTGTTNSNLTINNAGVFIINSVNATFDIGAFSGAGSISYSGGVSGTGVGIVWRVGGLNTNTVYSGIMNAVSAGNFVTFRKVGTGTLTYSGTMASTAGAGRGIYVDGGTLVLQGTGTTAIKAVPYNIADGATLQFNPTATLTFSGVRVRGTGNSTFAVGGTFNFTNSATLTNITNYHVLTGAISQFGTWLGSATTNLVVNGSLFTINPVTATFGSLSGTNPNANIVKQTATALNLTIGALNTNTTYAGRFQFGLPANTTNFTKVGTGSLTFTGDNSQWQNGTKTINGGTLIIGGATSLGTGATTVNAGGTLTFTVDTTGTKTVTVNVGGVVNKGGFPHATTTFTNLGGTINA